MNPISHSDVPLDEVEPPKVEKPFSVKQAIAALEKTARAFRTHDVVMAEFDKDDPRPPKQVTREQWYAAAANVLASGKLNSVEKAKVKKLKMEMALSSKKK